MTDSSNDIVKVDKSSWPRTTEGTIDWEVVFEHPTNGLIPAISMAQKTDTLIDCAAIITQTLFARASDEDIRAGYTTQLASIALNNSDGNIDTLLQQIVEFLHSIKVDRIERAADWVFHKSQQNAAKELLANYEDNDEAKLKRANTDETELMFEDQFCDAVDQRFQVLWGGVEQKSTDGRKIPFIVSPEFALRFQLVVRKELIPLVVLKCQRIIQAAKEVPESERKEHIRIQMLDELVRKELWDVWKDAWRHALQEPKLPAKPKVKKAGMLKSLINSAQTIGENGEPYSLEDWEEDLETAKFEQTAVRDAWRALMAPSDVFEPPGEEDKLLLMNMFAKTPGGLREHISAIRQISQQTQRAGQTFDTFAKGKDLDLPLLAVAHQYPEVFLQGKKVLKDMLRGMTKKEKAKKLPLIVRYLSDYI